MIICVDFDGTCVMHEYPKVGQGVGAAPVLLKLVERGHQLILFTMRSGRELQDAVEWFDSFKIPLYGVNFNPTQHTWTSSPKAYGHMYIDDAALGIPLITPAFGGRPFVCWESVSKMLQAKGIL